MTNYNLKAIIPPSIAAKAKKEARKKLLEEIRARRLENHKRYQKKRRLQADSDVL